MAALPYLANQCYSRATGFFRHWYADGLRSIGREAVNLLESLDRMFAWRITAANLFQPLYQDHTAVGHLFGFVFRLFRLLAGSAVYLAVIAAAAGAALAWASIPILIIWYGIRP